MTETRYWDDVGEDWAQRSPDALWRAHSDAINTTLLENWLPAGRAARVLKTDLFDEACTQGLAPLLMRRADWVVGIDISVAVIAAAKKRNPTFAGLYADVRNLPFADGVFDVIISNSTLDHFRSLDELTASLAELHRVMRPGGRLVLTLDNPLNPAVALRNALPFGLLKRIGIVPYFVGVTCGPRQLGRLLAAQGFTVTETTAVLHCPRALAVLACRALVAMRASAAAKRRLLAGLTFFERAARLPTRYLSGYYVAVSAAKSEDAR